MWTIGIMMGMGNGDFEAEFILLTNYLQKVIIENLIVHTRKISD